MSNILTAYIGGRNRLELSYRKANNYKNAGNFF